MTALSTTARSVLESSAAARSAAARPTAHPLLGTALERLSATAKFRELARQLRSVREPVAEPVEIVAAERVRPFLCAALAQHLAPHPLLVVVPTIADAHRISEDLGGWLGEGSVLEFPAWETLPFERVSPDTLTMGRRLETIARLQRLTADLSTEPSQPLAIVASVRALAQRLAISDPSGSDSNTEIEAIEIAKGDFCDPQDLAARLVRVGYRRELQVEHRGEFALRGGIVDVFASTAQMPVRIDLWGDEVERITEFAIDDQRSVGTCQSAQIFGARELLIDEAMKQRAQDLEQSQRWGAEHWRRIAAGEVFDGIESWLPWLVEKAVTLTDLLPAEAQVLLVEPQRLRDRCADIAAETEDLAQALATTWGVRTRPDAATDSGDNSAAGSGFPLLHVGFDRLLERCEAGVAHIESTTAADSVDDASAALVFESREWEPITPDSSRLIDQLRSLSQTGPAPGSPSAVGGEQRAGLVVIAADSAASARRITESLAELEVPLTLSLTEPSATNTTATNTSGGHVIDIALTHSFVLAAEPAPQAPIAVLSESDLSGRRRTHRPAKRRRQAQAAFDDLKPGDYVVHHHHGIARFAGLIHRSFGAAARDYLELEFRGTDRLYLPTDQIELIRPYVGGETPSVSKMGGTDFERQKSRVRSEVERIAQELVVLYQRRLAVAGFGFDTDSMWMQELADSFAYIPTPDQQSAIDEVLSDMASDSPMDRLVCGDVGFGKTEVAVRAAMCAATNGKQVAVLVPTTLLAQQHHQTFTERLGAHSVNIASLSRFLTSAQQRQVVADLARGQVDIVIGTHRLLSSDVVFKDLGLLVIDEEQRFGVKHKEALKHIKESVDVLTLTATPIPRTLEMSLTGIRDLSLLQTPPQERRPILTHVAPYDESAVSEAIRRELLREGQAFYVHNRVADIDTTAEHLRKLVPEARVAVAHGQMDESALEQVVIDFWEQRYDVLVCTSIIESGIDMPSVNTLVVDRADALGLGQLHQIRGRVGRSPQRAYAYLFYPQNKVLSESAYERLRTIGEATQLGSGYRIAMRDLQLRGAGNLLSGVQSGHIAAVGYDLYCEMVSDAFAELRGEPRPKPKEISIELPVKAYLPDEYVPSSDQRLEAYRRLGSVTQMVEVADIETEWLDRFGPIPPTAKSLLHIGLLRTECERLGLNNITFAAAGRVHISPLSLSPSEQTRLARVAAEHGFGEVRHKAPQPGTEDEPPELQLEVTRLDADLPGRVFTLLRDLRPEPPPGTRAAEPERTLGH